MDETWTPPATARAPVVFAPEPTSFTVPARHNPRLQRLVERLNGDEELRQLWRCANVNALERLGLGDSGEVHARIVANAGLKLLRLLRDANIAPGVVENHHLPHDDAEVVVVLAAVLHDLGLAFHPDPRLGPGLVLAERKGRELLADLYPVRVRTIVMAEALHAISARFPESRCLTLEASVLRLADVLDMTKGRAAAGPVAAPSPDLRIDEVTIQRHTSPPVRVILQIGALASLRTVEALLRLQLRQTSLPGRVELAAQVEARGQRRLIALRVWDDPT